MEDIEHDAHNMRAFLCTNVVGPAPPLPRYDATFACNASHGAVCCRTEQNKNRNPVP